MGEAKRKSRERAEILAADARCIYCDSVDGCTVEHMPPIGMFKDRDRPSGWEFKCCRRCNQGTKSADAVAQLVAKMEVISQQDWKLSDLLKLRPGVLKSAPGVWEEIFGGQWDDVLVRRHGLLYPSKSASISGPLVKRTLDLFSAKLAMAAFRELVGRPLERESFIYSEWFLNAGMSPERYETMVSIMPGLTQLKQGRKVSGQQFSLRYNTDEKGIVAAVFSFHGSFHVAVLATDNAELMGPIHGRFAELSRHVHPSLNLTRAGLPEIEWDETNKTTAQKG